MKFSVPKTLSGVYSPLMLMNWILGLGVIEYPIGKPRRLVSALLSILNFLMTLTFVRMANFSEIMELQGSKIAAMSYSIDIYFCIVFVGISMCLAPARIKVLKSSYFKLDVVNDRLKILGIPDDYSQTFQSHILQQSVIFVLMSILMALDFKFVGFEFPTETSRLGFLLTGHYLLVYAVVIDRTFSCTIRYFGNRFRHLNELLTEWDPIAERQTVQVTDWQLDHQFPRFPSVINEIYRNHSLSWRTTEKQSLLYVIRETRKIHRRLCKMVMTVNRAFGIHVILSVTLSFGAMASLSYTSYALYVTTSTISFGDLVGRVIAPMWLIFHVIKVLMSVEACETTSYEAERTGGLISKLLEMPACDEDIGDEINIFLFQLIQNPLSFTANGFLPLNYGMVGGMIGSVTTYVIIMIQMRSVYEPEKLGITRSSTFFDAPINNTN